MFNVGRNDPCPCGSGLKFKKCCFGKPSPSRQALLDDWELGQQRIREYEEKSTLLEPLPVDDSVDNQ